MTTKDKPAKQNAFSAGITKAATASGVTKLSDLQRKKPVVHEGELIQKVSPGQVECKPQIRSKDNPGFTEASLNELGDDIEQNGQGEPAVVRPHPNPASGFDYEMVAGERRQRACAIKGILLDVVVRNLTDAQAKRIQRSENVQREGLTQLEIALALKADKDELGTLQAVANEWKKGLNWVAERLKYLEIMEADGAGRAAVESGITADVSVVNDLNRLEKADPQAAAALLKRAEDEPDLNIRTEVRGELQKAKGIRPKAIRIGGKKKPAQPAKTQAASANDSAEDPAAVIEKLREEIMVQAAHIATLENENTYLQGELSQAREQLNSKWKPDA